MQWAAVLFPRRLQLKVLLVVSAALLCFLICAVLLHRELYRSQHLTEVQLKGFPGHEDKARDEEDILVHLKRNWKEPEWKVAEILRLLPAMKKPVVPVFVVEEHHEVLKYWFDAADTGALPKSGNTLLHIDGHPDNGPPRDPWIVPWFRLPRNHSEVANMMQSNDVFVAGAALAGLINRFIWVWPDWDRAEHKDESDHEILDIKAGWRFYYPHNGKAFRRFCACEKQRTHQTGTTGEPEWSCWDDEPDPSLMAGGPMVQGLQCKAEVTGVVEYVHESKAIELLQQGDWIRKDENVMLDIDEDYYGCESSVMPLINSGMTLPEIYKLSALVGRLLCVNEVHYELAADRFFQVVFKIVEEFRSKVCPAKSSKGRQNCLSDFESDKALVELIPTIYHSLQHAGIEEQLCDDPKAAEVLLQVIIRSLYKLNEAQFNALQYVGVCLQTAPTSFTFQPESLHVCHGFNVPGDMAVSIHVPTHKENKARTEILKKTLSLLPRQPSVVTICRSMRDGYTPWAFFDSIEAAIVKTLKSVFENVTDNSFHYDENLLGGRVGWPSRKEK